jgi:hypothetical protein
MQNTILRTIVATFDDKLAQLTTDSLGTAPVAPAAVLELRATWVRLVAALALGPEPEVRVCPSCSQTVMRAALRCGYCWAKLRPPATNEA